MNALVPLAHLAVLHALERFNKKQLTTPWRGRFKSVPPHALHTVLPLAQSCDIEEVLGHAFDRIADVLPPEQARVMVACLQIYVHTLIRTRTLPSESDLVLVLRECA